tara:strand:+ start:133 stop:1521 length:1389 start_codon:yes stop_codon:yes gene_type:complete
MAVAAGYHDTVIVGEDGCLFACGGNYFGELGTGNLNKQYSPTRIAGLPAPVRQVAAGNDHTGIVTEAGDLLMCGLGGDGRLGLGEEETRATPTLVARTAFDCEAVLMVACGGKHTVVVTEGGGVYTFGKGGWGQLGHGDKQNQPAPRRVPVAGFRPNGSPEGSGERIAMVAAGHGHTVALSEAGHVFTWGLGNTGELGHNNLQNQLAPRQVESGRRFGGEKVVFVAAGAGHTVAVTEGGRLYTWGWGTSGQLGHGDTRNRLVPTLVGAGAFGRVVMAACGGAHTLVVTHDGALWACGEGWYGQLGLNDKNERHVFERVGVGAFGGARVVAAAAGKDHSAAVTEDGALWTWGNGYAGQLGHGNPSALHIFLPKQVTAQSLDSMRVGQFHSTMEDICAFYMSQHPRLGANSVAKNLKPELLDMIVRMNIPNPSIVRMSPPKPSNDAMSRLLGLPYRVRTCKYCS